MFSKGVLILDCCAKKIIQTPELCVDLLDKVLIVLTPELFAFKAVCGGIEELTDYTLLSKGKKEGKVMKYFFLVNQSHPCLPWYNLFFKMIIRIHTR